MTGGTQRSISSIGGRKQARIGGQPRALPRMLEERQQAVG